MRCNIISLKCWVFPGDSVFFFSLSFQCWRFWTLPLPTTVPSWWGRPSHVSPITQTLSVCLPSTHSELWQSNLTSTLGATFYSTQPPQKNTPTILSSGWLKTIVSFPVTHFDWNIPKDTLKCHLIRHKCFKQWLLQSQMYHFIDVQMEVSNY